MKEDVPGNQVTKCIPILDTQMEVVDGQIIHHHFSKPMASLEITHSRSAMSKSAKLSILVQEGIRRIRNCSPTLPWEEPKMLLNKPMVQMLWAEYTTTDRETVVRRILSRIENTGLA